MPVSNTDDDVSYEWMFFIGESSRGGDTSFWISNNAGLGVIDTMVTSDGDKLVWGD